MTLRRFICRKFHRASWNRERPGKRVCAKCSAVWVGRYGVGQVDPSTIPGRTA